MSVFRRPACGGCGSRIRVREPVWVARTDGSYRFARFLGLRSWIRGRHFWHLGCLAADYPPSWRRRPGRIDAPRPER
jgi:hypothetical protein